jgi:hypothetical protein
MKNMNMLALEYYREHPPATLRDAIKYAETSSFTEDDAIVFAREFLSISCKQKQLLSDVSRIWPEKKGY